jgi:hypothetical protein
MEEKKQKTKRVHGVDCGACCFAFIGNATDTNTWHVCLHVPGNSAKTVNAVRMALGRFDEMKGIPDGEREAVWHVVRGAALALGIRVEERAKREAPAHEPKPVAEPPAAQTPLSPVVVKQVEMKEDPELDRALEAAAAMADAKATAWLKAIGLE